LANWQTVLERWRAAGLLDDSTAQRIQGWESSQSVPQSDRLAPLAFGLGGLLLAAGVLLFVAAHWDELSPALRFTLVLAMVALFHGLAAATKSWSPALATSLHAAGTASLGAGIYLAGQIFNMAEHWPGGLMLWSVGAVAALYLLRDWPHALWVALLVPTWLFGEWIEFRGDPRFGLFGPSGFDTPAIAGLVLLAFVYLSARVEAGSPVRTALSRLGAIALIPVTVWLGLEAQDAGYWPTELGARPRLSTIELVVGWGVAVLVPGALVLALRRREARWFGLALAWVVLFVAVTDDSQPGELAMYLMFALAAVGLVVWGLREQRQLTVNIGVLGFALTVLFFYFDSLFDKLGRSLSLIALGILFIGGGWLLERTRRRLIGRILRSAA
jgi:uncharacterized membrane protein